MSVGWIILLLAVGLSQDGLSDFLSEMNFQSFMLFALPPFLLLGIGYFMRWVFRGFRWPSQLRNLSRSVESVISETITWPLVYSVLSVTVGEKSFLTNGCPLVRRIWITWTKNLNVGTDWLYCCKAFSSSCHSNWSEYNFGERLYVVTCSSSKWINLDYFNGSQNMVHWSFLLKWEISRWKV